MPQKCLMENKVASIPKNSTQELQIHNDKGKDFLALNYWSTIAQRHIGEWRYGSTILDIGTRRRWVIRQFHALAALTPGKEPPPQYPLYRGVGGLLSRYRFCGEDKNFLSLPGMKPSHPFSLQPLTIPTQLRMLIRTKIMFKIMGFEDTNKPNKL
jgi:hypothetical protein